jgi:hypothetical protein
MFSCSSGESTPQDVDKALSGLIGNRWETYKNDEVFAKFTVAQMIYYTECEASHLGLLPCKKRATIHVVPEHMGEKELKVLSSGHGSVEIIVEYDGHRTSRILK